MNETGILGLFCGAASLSGLMLSINFYFNKKQKNYSHIFLALLFLGVTIRISKSLWYFILYDVAEWGIIAGFLGMGMIGPALWLYIKQSHNVPLSRWDWAHMVLPITGLILRFSLELPYGVLYKSMTGIMALYIGCTLIRQLKHPYESDELRKYNWIILISSTFIWAAFLFQDLSGTLLSYAYGAGFASLVIYGLSISKMTKSLHFNDSVKSKTILPDHLIGTIQSAFESEKVYLKTGITLNQFAKDVNTPAYLITKGVNKIYGKSFPETVNYFRVNEVKRQLENYRNKVYKIESLAFEAGFATPSSFYTAFKKETGMTPTSYQKQFFLEDPKVA